MTDATSTAKKAVKDPETKAREKRLYTTGYWDAIRGVRTEFGEGSLNIAVYNKGIIAGTNALEKGTSGWKPKRPPKPKAGRVILPTVGGAVDGLVEQVEADTAEDGGTVAIDGVVADSEAQARILAEEAEASAQEQIANGEESDFAAGATGGADEVEEEAHEGELVTAG